MNYTLHALYQAQPNFSTLPPLNNNISENLASTVLHCKDYILYVIFIGINSFVNVVNNFINNFNNYVGGCSRHHFENKS